MGSETPDYAEGSMSFVREIKSLKQVLSLDQSISHSTLSLLKESSQILVAFAGTAQRSHVKISK